MAGQLVHEFQEALPRSSKCRGTWMFPCTIPWGIGEWSGSPMYSRAAPGVGSPNKAGHEGASIGGDQLLLKHLGGAALHSSVSEKYNASGAPLHFFLGSWSLMMSCPRKWPWAPQKQGYTWCADAPSPN